MSVLGNTCTNSGVQQATFGAVLDRVTSGFMTHSLRRDQPDDEPRDGGAAPVDSRKQITELARTATRQSTATGTDMFAYQPGSDLDPYSPAFDAEKWTRGLSKLNREAGSGYTSGIAYRNLSVHGFGSDSDYQRTVANLPLAYASTAKTLLAAGRRKVQILDSLDGVLDSGEMLVVLGPPGSGCSTMLKTIAGEMNGIYLDENAELNYRGITPEEMKSRMRGEAIYTAEVDVHFPKLTVGETLAFAAEARCPRNPPGGLTRRQYALHMRDVAMAVFGISHTINTVVGNDFIRGVSGGERKRVSIAEAALSCAPLQCWDNSTRGLDSANAIEFCKNLKMGSTYMGISSVVAIYQAPQSAYDLFDKVCVLYEGQQIFFGRTTEAKQFFVDMGFECREQQTTPDFLTSLTSRNERKARPGYEDRVPRTAAEFAAAWKKSNAFAALHQEIAKFQERHQLQGEHRQQFLQARRAQQSRHVRAKSPYTLSYMSQIRLCLRRGFWRLKADPAFSISQVIGNFIIALITSSVFYDLQLSTNSFFQRGSLLFFSILLNAFSTSLEILTLYAQRPIVEKHVRYAFYHSSAEAVASMLTDLPAKILGAVATNVTLYFMSNLRRSPGPFFYYFLISFSALLTMSMVFRSIAAVSRQFVQAMTPAAVIMIGLVVYTGFVIPVNYMHGWARWINYINPIAYAFEALMLNEFHGRDFECSQLVPSGPGYTNVTGNEQACNSIGSVAGSTIVNGDSYLNTAFGYYDTHRWRNFGILSGFMFAFLIVYLVATELVSAKKSKGEILLFRRGHMQTAPDLEAQNEKERSEPTSENEMSDERAKAVIRKQTAVFSWKDVVYDIKTKGETRRILDHVDGWVKPGTLTALMGVSGAGKTTLLDVLATRVTTGVVRGEMLVDGRSRDASFQRKTGYVQQQDLHLHTGTVREALRFSALLRQPRSVPDEDKYAYVEEVLHLLDMEPYGDAVIGVPGEGLNVEQRKRLTIGVEMAAKPELLLFLDEPTSGLDSQTSWNILQLLRKLTNHGQAILCTIHQPSAILFENFDRLLFLARGGKTVYFGEVGPGSQILIDYLEENGATPYPKGENPAEWMLAAIGASPGSHTDVDWHRTWLKSPERARVRDELESLKLSGLGGADSNAHSKSMYAEFAAPLTTQLRVVCRRVLQQYWRTPAYIWSKFLLSICTGLFIGFSFFKADTSLQGLQNQLFSTFIMFTIFSQLVQQLMPNFVTQRSLYESRERPAKTYSWKVFILSNILVEIPWSLLAATVFFFCYYYPIGYYNNAIPTNTVHLRGALMWLYVVGFFLFTSTFAIAVIAGIEMAETAGNIANLMSILCLVFCGVLATAQSLPGFWIFMYRVSPFTYLVKGILAVGVANADVVCSADELLQFEPASGQTCGEYMSTWISTVGGYLTDSDATTGCSFCPITSTNEYLASFDIKYSEVWRNFGLIWAYIAFNIFAAFALYWLVRVPKPSAISKFKRE